MSVTCKISNSLEITGLPTDAQNIFESMSQFNTNAFQSTEIPPNLTLFSKDGPTIKILRGYLPYVIDYCNQHKLKLDIVDTTCKGIATNFIIDSKVNYKSGVFGYQDKVVDQLLQHTHCRLQVPAGGGKTTIACILMAKVNKGPSLFLVNKDKLLRQFVNTAKQVLNLEEDDIGIIKAKKNIIKPITVGSLQTLGKETFDLESIKNTFHTVFFDECHISSALTYRSVLLGLAPHRLYGLSATPEHYASEGLNDLMFGLLGPIAVTIREDEIPERMFPSTATIETGKSFYYNSTSGDPSWKQHKARNDLYNSIASDDGRNEMIVDDCRKLIKKGHKVLITVARVFHGETLAAKLREQGVRVSFPYKIKKREGKETDQKVDHKQLDKDVADVIDGNLDVMIGTYNLFQTGFDCKVLSALQMASPFSGTNSTTLIQVFGRIQRHSYHKQPPIALDYTDSSYPVDCLGDWSNSRMVEMKKRFGPHEVINRNKS